MRLQEFVSYRLLPHTYSLQVADPGDAPGCEAYETPVVLDRQQYVVANPKSPRSLETIPSASEARH